MPANSGKNIQASEVVLPCSELDSTLTFFTEILGFQINSIFPADAPLVALISGYGVNLRLDCRASGDPGKLRIFCQNPEEFAEGATELIAPNGTIIEIVEADTPLLIVSVLIVFLSLFLVLSLIFFLDNLERFLVADFFATTFFFFFIFFLDFLTGLVFFFLDFGFATFFPLIAIFKFNY